MIVDFDAASIISQAKGCDGDWGDDSLDFIQERLLHQWESVWSIVVNPTAKHLAIDHEGAAILANRTAELLRGTLQMVSGHRYVGQPGKVVEFCDNLAPHLIVFMRGLESRLQGSGYEQHFRTEYDALLNEIGAVVAFGRFATVPIHPTFQ